MAKERRYEPEVLRRYDGQGVVVHWEPKLCIHFANCIRMQPGVFDPNARPWVRVDAASVDDFASAIRACPTGALRYERTDGSPQEAPDVPTTVEPRRNGPLFVRGDVQVIGNDGTITRTGTRMALCRCGHSSNKPFCDGSHLTAGFQDNL